MKAMSRGLKDVEQEVTASEGDGAISARFHQASNNFLLAAEADLHFLSELYSEAGRNANSLLQYFGENPVQCTFEQVTSILVMFVKMFERSIDEKSRLAESSK